VAATQIATAEVARLLKTAPEVTDRSPRGPGSHYQAWSCLPDTLGTGGVGSGNAAAVADRPMGCAAVPAAAPHPALVVPPVRDLPAGDLGAHRSMTLDPQEPSPPEPPPGRPAAAAGVQQAGHAPRLGTPPRRLGGTWPGSPTCSPISNSGRTSEPPRRDPAGQRAVDVTAAHGNTARVCSAPSARTALAAISSEIPVGPDAGGPPLLCPTGPGVAASSNGGAENHTRPRHRQ